ncbi:hypothetical protein [Falsirhodobacter xinxiangensis]|uniref:hypothetical protein n=1 Tax=Falsirhodobacter xinxiangensis TaxID=2530049 RepID=UPI00145AEDC3|nr:hypothetical protein [Rhodobacter xinxiangensis]
MADYAATVQERATMMIFGAAREEGFSRSPSNICWPDITAAPRSTTNGARRFAPEWLAL